MKTLSTFSSRHPTGARPGLSGFALALALMLPVCPKAAVAAETLDAIVAQLVARSEKQAQLFNAGRVHEWYDLVGLSDDFTLMQPFGGATDHGFEATEERLAALARNFQNGDARLEVDATYATDDMVVLAYVERQDGEVHGLPTQDWSLRVTQVFRRQGQEWRLVHRHADPLVRPISLEATAALAAGRGYSGE